MIQFALTASQSVDKDRISHILNVRKVAQNDKIALLFNQKTWQNVLFSKNFGALLKLQTPIRPLHWYRSLPLTAVCPLPDPSSPSYDCRRQR